MKPLTTDELLPYADYEQERSSFRQRIIALKKRRRISVGDLITLVFENRETIRFQIQEMIRTERIFDPLKIQEELDVYNALLPAQGELSATFFIEITETERIKDLLDSFQDIDRPGTVAIHVGTETISAEFEAGHSKEDKISAVHFVRFRPHASFLEHLTNKEKPASLHINHKAYQAEATVSEEMRQEWLSDLGLVSQKTLNS